MRDLDYSLGIFTEVAVAWVMKACKIPLLSVVREPETSLNFF